MSVLPIAAPVLALACAIGVQGPGAPPKPEINREWLAKDLQRIEQLRGALEARELTVEGLRRALRSSDVREDRDIGFGSRRMHLAAYGGYTTAWIRILAEARDGERESRVARIEIQHSGSGDSFEQVASQLRAAWKRPMREVEGGLALEREDAALALALRKKTQDALGGPIEVEVPEGLAAAFERLTSPLDELFVGESFGIHGGPPPGALEIRALVDAKRFDLVRAVLRGLNPEGRVYAAHALLARGSLEPRDQAAIAKLRALRVELSTCSGCIVVPMRFDEALRHLDS